VAGTGGHGVRAVPVPAAPFGTLLISLTYAPPRPSPAYAASCSTLVLYTRRVRRNDADGGLTRRSRRDDADEAAQGAQSAMIHPSGELYLDQVEEAQGGGPSCGQAVSGLCSAPSHLYHVSCNNAGCYSLALPDRALTRLIAPRVASACYGFLRYGFLDTQGQATHCQVAKPHCLRLYFETTGASLPFNNFASVSLIFRIVNGVCCCVGAELTLQKTCCH
jgi:hypothetical protein